ncbi:unnamed protein product, partial [Sphacelaria rigidula]
VDFCCRAAAGYEQTLASVHLPTAHPGLRTCYVYLHAYCFRRRRLGLFFRSLLCFRSRGGKQPQPARRVLVMAILATGVLPRDVLVKYTPHTRNAVRVLRLGTACILGVAKT